MTKIILALLFYLVAINIIAFFLYGIDKWKARHDKWRITEARLVGTTVRCSRTANTWSYAKMSWYSSVRVRKDWA